MLLAGLIWAGGGKASIAQNEDCETLRQQMTEGADTARSAQYARAVQGQRMELARTHAYADQIGCDGGFSIFSDAQPGQCDAIEARIRHMENNLAALESQLDRLRHADPDEQAALAARYRTYCSTGPGDTLGGDENGDSMRPGLDDGDGGDQPADGNRSMSGKPICVRTCDGGYFPLGPSRTGDIDGLQSLCTALCPNTEAKLYSTPSTDDLSGAVAADGTAYTALPAAFKFQKTFDAACTCKPPQVSWVDALAQAEALLEKGEKDVVVTRQMSDAMARPTSAKPVAAPRQKTAKSQSDIKAATDGAVAAQAPTASSDSAGIAAAPGNADTVIKTGEGPVKDVVGPDGAKRRVRIIAPLL